MSSRPAKRSKIHWPTAIQFGGSGLGLVLFWTSAAGAVGVGLYQLILDPSGPSTALEALLLAWAASWAGLLLLPSIVHSFARLARKPVVQLRFKDNTDLLLPLLVLLVFLATLVAGHLTAQVPSLSWIALPPIHILAATLPLAWIVFASIRKLDLGSRQRKWGALASGLTLGPSIAVILEATIGASLVLLAAAYIGLNPDLLPTLNLLIETLENSAFSQQDLMQAAGQLLDDPFLYALLVVNFSIFVPLIEEIVKPVAVWLLLFLGPLTPAAGFGLGLLSGAGFALLENLFSGASSQDWAATAAIRVGATAFHLGTSALMGWAIVRARNERRYGWLLGIFLLNIVLHGIWNAVVITNSVSAISLGDSAAVAFQISLASGLILLAITLISFGLLAYIRRQLLPTKTAPSPVSGAKPSKKGPSRS